MAQKWPLWVWAYNKRMNTLREQIEALCQENHIQLMYVFGSRAGEVLALLQGKQKSLAKSTSDVDIAILTRLTLTFDQKVGLALALEAIFAVERVDLVFLRDADPFLAANIIRGERLYALDPDDADEYDLFVLRRAGDLAEMERERIALILHEEPTAYDAG